MSCFQRAICSCLYFAAQFHAAILTWTPRREFTLLFLRYFELFVWHHAFEPCHRLNTWNWKRATTTLPWKVVLFCHFNVNVNKCIKSTVEYVQFHSVGFAVCSENCLGSTCSSLWRCKFEYARTPQRNKCTHSAADENFEVKAEYQQLNHNKQADTFSCKLQATSLQSHITATFLILSMIGGS